jgi:hypothetical protein
MSKLLEALKASVRENKETTAKSEYDSVQEQLANVYLAGEKNRKSDYPVIIKVIEKKGLSSAIPWIITSLAFLLTAFSLFSTKRIFVDVQVIDEKSPYIAALRRGSLLPETDSWTPPHEDSSKEDAGEGLQLKGAVFEGASKLKSFSERNLLTLVNTSVAPFARAAVTLPQAANLSGYKIVFYAKGAKGGENVAFALKDRDNVLAFAKGKVFPFPGALTTEWQKAEITLDEAVGAFNEKSVTGMRFEFGSNVQNRPGDTVYVKNVRIVPL